MARNYVVSVVLACYACACCGVGVVHRRKQRDGDAALLSHTAQVEERVESWLRGDHMQDQILDPTICPPSKAHTFKDLGSKCINLKGGVLSVPRSSYGDGLKVYNRRGNEQVIGEELKRKFWQALSDFGQVSENVTVAGGMSVPANGTGRCNFGYSDIDSVVSDDMHIAVCPTLKDCEHDGPVTNYICACISEQKAAAATFSWPAGATVMLVSGPVLLLLACFYLQDLNSGSGMMGRVAKRSATGKSQATPSTEEKLIGDGDTNGSRGGRKSPGPESPGLHPAVLYAPAVVCCFLALALLIGGIAFGIVAGRDFSSGKFFVGCGPNAAHEELPIVASTDLEVHMADEQLKMKADLRTAAYTMGY